MEITKDINLYVIGAGKVGMSIVQAFAQQGFNVTAIDISENNLKTGLEKIQNNLNQMVDKGKFEKGQKEVILEKIRQSTNFDDISNADVVIEAVFEDIDLKKKLFGQMDNCVISSEALLLTNTSSLSISAIASATKRPEFVAGMHFFNPVPVMKLVEIVRGIETSDETAEKVKDLATLLNKTTIVSKDSPGFIVNRLLNALFIEACRIVEEGVGTPHDIDTGLKLGLGHPNGPFELVDNLDAIPLIVHVCEHMSDELGSRFKPPVWIKNYEKAGRVGKSSKKGIYEY
ncbi:MAG: 3-hydroxyacyl-CoA dehydrogenase family protein [Proteobacteria bacterium]|nr:3-hydroxyacyl-CoA dehydrogenase family protein [Pseudomonadota bacterium]